MAMNFDAIIIGTGFGGTIAATRLAAKGKKVLMLERGTWWVTPAKIGKAPPSTRPSDPCLGQNTTATAPSAILDATGSQGGHARFFRCHPQRRATRTGCINIRCLSRRTFSLRVVWVAVR